MAKRKDRPSWFKMFNHHKALIDSVPDEIAGRAIKAVFQYFDSGEVGELEPLAFAVFSSIKPFVDESFTDFQKNRERNSKNIRKRWDKEIPSVTTGTSGNHSIPPIPSDTKYTEAEAEAEADAEADAETEANVYGFFSSADSAKKSSSTPTVDEIREYCKEKKYSFDPVAFESYYRAKGWMMGNTPVRDWKAVADFWNQNRGGTTYDNQKNKVPYGSGDLGEAEQAAIRKLMKED